MHKPPLSRPLHRRLFSTSRSLRQAALDLAFSRHDPPNPTRSSAHRAPIILLHGLFGSQRNNRTMSKVLARDLNRPIYLLDLRNHGSSPHSPTHTYTAMATDVEHFITTHSLPSPILIGHSMGAKVAMTLALRRPENYTALVPVDNAPVDAALKSDFDAYVRGLREIEEKNPPVQSAREADDILQKYEGDLGIRQFLLTNLVRTPDGEGQGKDGVRFRFRIPLPTLAKALPDMADFPFKDPGAARFEGPTLVVRGSRSRYVADEVLPVVGEFFPRFELLEVESGHWVMSEGFEEFRSGLVEWIGRVVDGDC